MGVAAMDVLCCRITIGDADPSNPMKIRSGVEITEVHTLEINESYKKLIGTAKVTFPKGTVCRFDDYRQYDTGRERCVPDNDRGHAGWCDYRKAQHTTPG